MSIPIICSPALRPVIAMFDVNVPGELPLKVNNRLANLSCPYIRVGAFVSLREGHAMNPVSPKKKIEARIKTVFRLAKMIVRMAFFMIDLILLLISVSAVGNWLVLQGLSLRIQSRYLRYLPF